MDFETLVGMIYEAGALPALWPSVLSALGRACGAGGGLFFHQSSSGGSWVAAPEVSWIIEKYIEQGWMADNVRGAPMIAELHPGFRTDSDFRSADERATLPVYRDFLIPNGIDAAAGTVFQGAKHDAVVLTVEHFPSHHHAAASVPLLDRLRPHLGRALTISARLRGRDAGMIVDGIALLGTAAAIVDEDGQLRAANQLFNERLGNEIFERTGRLTFCNGDFDSRFANLLGRYRLGQVASQSIPFKPHDETPPFVLHILPLHAKATEVFNSRGLLIVLADGANTSIPSADLLRLLFDLTPTEARLARQLAEGETLAGAAQNLGVKYVTTRSHLKMIFAKTGVSRQSELVQLLAGYGLKTA